MNNLQSVVQHSFYDDYKSKFNKSKNIKQKIAKSDFKAIIASFLEMWSDFWISRIWEIDLRYWYFIL